MLYKVSWSSVNLTLSSWLSEDHRQGLDELWKCARASSLNICSSTWTNTHIQRDSNTHAWPDTGVKPEDSLLESVAEPLGIHEVNAEHTWTRWISYSLTQRLLMTHSLPSWMISSHDIWQQSLSHTWAHDFTWQRRGFMCVWTEPHMYQDSSRSSKHASLL